MNLTIRTKLYASFGIILLIMTTLSFYAGFMMRQIDQKAAEIAYNWLPSVSEAHKIYEMTEEYRLLEYDHIVSVGPAEMAQAERQMKELNGRILESAKTYESILSSEEDRKLFLDGKAKWINYVQMSEKALALSRQGDYKAAGVLMTGEAKTVFDEASAALFAMIEFNSKNGQIASAESEEIFDTSMMALVVGVIVALAASAVIVFLLCRNINGSIEVLLAASNQIAAGDFRVNLNARGNDELGMLMKAYNIMIGNLKGMAAKMRSASDHVAQVAEELNTGAEQSSDVTNQITASIASVANLADDQVKSVGSTLSLIDRISSEIDTVSEGAAASTRQAESTVQTAQRGNRSVVNAIEQMRHIEKTVNVSADVVSKLGERSKEIGQIVDTISGIAGQTNLLALNAAIEAARAGEHGKGFAVVAEEVRKLAEQSQGASKQIAALIGEIQTDTDRAVAAMQDGTKEVKVGTEAVSAVGASFGEIVGLAEHTAKQAVEASAIVQELAGEIHQIAGASRLISESSNTVSSEAQTVSAATQEQLAVVEQIGVSASNLTKLAYNLNETIREIKV